MKKNTSRHLTGIDTGKKRLEKVTDRGRKKSGSNGAREKGREVLRERCLYTNSRGSSSSLIANRWGMDSLPFVLRDGFIGFDFPDFQFLFAIVIFNIGHDPRHQVAVLREELRTRKKKQKNK